MNIEKDLRYELKKAESEFTEYNSAHEGYAIIKEEFDELWDEIKKHDHNESRCIVKHFMLPVPLSGSAK